MQTWLAFLISTVWETFFPHITSFSVDFTYICENVLSSKHTNTHACPRLLTVIINTVKSMLLSVVLTSTLQYCLLPIGLDNLLWGVIWIQTAYNYLVHWQCLVNVIPYANTWPFWCGRDSNFWEFFIRGRTKEKELKARLCQKLFVYTCMCLWRERLIERHSKKEKEWEWESRMIFKIGWSEKNRI